MKGRSLSSSIPAKRSSRGSRKQDAQPWTREGVLRELESLANPSARKRMAYFGIVTRAAHGIASPVLHKFARRIGKNHSLAEQLWASGIHEAQILAALIGQPEKVTSEEMNRWARDFDSWDVVDTVCRYLYVFASPAWSKIHEWSDRPEEYVKRAAFSLLAYLSYLDKQAGDAKFVRLLSLIERESDDERNFVRKAVNWALRNIGKRNLHLNRAAIQAAERIRKHGTRAARWIAADALRELTSEAVQQRLRRQPA
jgi:3-methyladenine DNA glycosylase AlkD